MCMAVVTPGVRGKVARPADRRAAAAPLEGECHHERDRSGIAEVIAARAHAAAERHHVVDALAEGELPEILVAALLVRLDVVVVEQPALFAGELPLRASALRYDMPAV